MLEKIERFYHRYNMVLGKILVIAMILMTVNVSYDVVMRYFFHNSSVAMQEMEWHLFSIIILFGMSVSLLDEGHVRVDFIYDRLAGTTKAKINIIGTIILLLPLAMLVLFGSIEFVRDAYDIGEISEDPGGLPYRWVIKAMIPLSFFLLLFSAFGYIVKNINIYRTLKNTPRNSHKEAGK
jgi:TRAP-type mannitol/chloroaromatic compound transport system permease small subunit